MCEVSLALELYFDIATSGTATPNMPHAPCALCSIVIHAQPINPSISYPTTIRPVFYIPNFQSHIKLGSCGGLFQSLLLPHLLAVLLETIAHALLRGHPLEHTAVDAAVFAGGDCLGGEVVDAGGEAVFNEAAEGLFAFVSAGCVFSFFSHMERS